MTNRMLHAARCLIILLDDSAEAADRHEFLRALDAQITLCTSLGAFRTYFEQLPVRNSDILLITSGSFGLRLRTDFQNDRYSRISSIYIWCQNKGAHQRWSSSIEQVSASIVVQQ